ncbi:MAG: type II toxin-antitoxin system VapC family toxin [Dethiobacteria bacterium]|nr:type II toxin-antitoxin system VapC family toxin [Bacillota bacterium]
MVVDASVALAWVLPGEDTKNALLLRNQAAENPNPILLIPPTFWFEVANVLWVAIRRNRIKKSSATKALEILQNFDFTVYPVDPTNCLHLSIAHDLAVYDSAYLHLALEQQAVLWTMDQALKKVAENLEVAALP